VHPASPWGESLVAGMKPTLARLEETLRLVCPGGLLCALTQSAEPPEAGFSLHGGMLAQACSCHGALKEVGNRHF